MAEISQDVGKLESKVNLAEQPCLIRSVSFRCENLCAVFRFIRCRTEDWWQPGFEIIWAPRLLSGYKLLP